jgi:hypothetical protein
MYDVYLIANKDVYSQEYKDLKSKIPMLKCVDSIDQAQKSCITKFFWAVYPDLDICEDFNFDYVPDDWSQDYVHVFLNDKEYDGISLIPKKAKISQKEIDYRFFVNKKFIEIVASNPKPYDYFEIDNYEQYCDALEKTKTQMFWMSSPNIKVNEVVDTFYISHHESSLRKQNHAFIHQVYDKKLYNGLFLCSKDMPLSKKEVDYRFPVARKEWDIVASGPVSYDRFFIDTYEEYLDALENSKTEMFWMDTKNINTDNFDFNFYFSFDQTYDREQNHAFIHRIDGEDYYNGLFLCSKAKPLGEREIEHRFPVNRKEWDIVASGPCKYDVFEISTFDQYTDALEKSKTEMFWMSSPNIAATIPDVYFTHDQKYNRLRNHAFIHKVKGKDYYNGLFLCSKLKPLSKLEVEYRHPVDRKEWDIVGSTEAKYQIYFVDSYQAYLNAYDNADTEMFYVVPGHIELLDDFEFDDYYNHNNEYDRTINHVFLNGDYHDGVVLCSKHSKISEREWKFMFIQHKKEQNKLVSRPKPYDMVFISYEEPNADENYQSILKKHPHCKRVHGVKGIHQAHIEAAKLCSTPMVWIIDGDAQIVEDFNFEYQVPVWQWDHVHVWRSRNPVNGLVYGYGGVKLFPRDLTINMDTSKPDMTTSISSKFRAIQQVSNVTAFNVGEFETWKSAFRECCKLSSKVIDRQKDIETDRRLKIWSSIGRDKPFGEFAIRGAKEGTLYGTENKDNFEALKMINDFDWLREKFNGNL